MKNLYITVIVSTYNSEDWLRKVLEGYKHQTYDFFEVIVVDDGSKETTKDLIDSFKLDYPVTLRHIILLVSSQTNTSDIIPGT